MLKLSARKLHTIFFLNHFLLKDVFWSVTFGNISAAKSRLNTVHKVTRPGTVAPVCVGPTKCLDVIYNHTNLLRSVLSICNAVLW